MAVLDLPDCIAHFRIFHVSATCTFVAFSGPGGRVHPCLDQSALSFRCRQLKFAIDLYLIPRRKTVALVGHPNHRHQFREHLAGHTRIPRASGMRSDAVAALIGRAYRKIDQLLRQRIQRSGRHDLLDAVPRPAECGRIVRQRLPKIIDPVRFARSHDVVEDLAHFGAGVSVFDET